MATERYHVTRPQLVRLYVDQGLTQTAIARIVGCSQFNVWRLLKLAGIETRAYTGGVRTCHCGALACKDRALCRDHLREYNRERKRRWRAARHD